MKRKVTRQELKAHIRAWPRKLEADTLWTTEPPARCFHDFTLGKESLVAAYTGNDKDAPMECFIFQELPASDSAEPSTVDLTPEQYRHMRSLNGDDRKEFLRKLR